MIMIILLILEYMTLIVACLIIHDITFRIIDAINYIMINSIDETYKELI